MDHREKLEKLHKESLERVNEYLKAKGELDPKHHEKLHVAKKDWELAWSKLMETLIVLENLEL
jgi:hypothetical protein